MSAALPLASYGLDKLYLFPYFQTREDFQRATGKEAPAFDCLRPPKRWFDPAAENTNRRNMFYERVLAQAANGQPLVTEQGTPTLEPLTLSKTEAATVNIPEAKANVPGADVPEVPVPLRALEPEEELYFGWAGIPFVHNKNYELPGTEAGFTAKDREILQAVARKLNVNLGF